MALLELIDKIDTLLSGGAPLAKIRGQLVVLREQVEALEQQASTPQTVSQHQALAAQRDRLKTLLNEAWDEIERLQFELHQQRDREPRSETPKERPDVIRLTHAQMVQSIESVPPFQQSNLMKSFVGKRVAWKASLQSMSNILEGVPTATYPVHVFCKLIEGARDEHDCLSCWASQRDAASLDGVQRDGMIRVTGTIRDVSKIGSTLEDCTFEPYQTNDT